MRADFERVEHVLAHDNATLLKKISENQQQFLRQRGNTHLQVNHNRHRFIKWTLVSLLILLLCAIIKSYFADNVCCVMGCMNVKFKC